MQENQYNIIVIPRQEKSALGLKLAHITYLKIVSCLAEPIEITVILVLSVS